MRSGPLDRFDVRPLLFDHFRSLRRLRPGNDGAIQDVGPDLTARIVLTFLPAGLGVASYWQGWKLVDPGSISAASALIAGILFAAFTQLATLRERLEDRSEPIDDLTRRHFRETAAHLMVGAFAAAVEAVILVGASGIRNHPDEKLATIPTSIVLAIGCYVFLVFTMSVRRMYSAYLRVFEGGQYLRADRRRRVSKRPTADEA
jgi:hypothetical protein